MKKKLLIVLAVLLCGCGTKEKDDLDDYKHYQLKESETVSYKLNLGYNNYATYALADISQGEGCSTGLFYQIDELNYILLDEIESCGEKDAHTNQLYNLFFDDKLYFVRCLGSSIIEYTLNGKDIQKKELKFDESQILKDIEDDGSLHYLETHKIDKVDIDYIYFSANIHNIDNSSVKIKCSLKDYKCEINE